MPRAPAKGRGAPAREAPPDAVHIETVADAAEVLRWRPAALITDLDGTLSPVAATPEAAFVLPDCRSALRSLAGRLDLVAVVSGRPASEARRLVGLRRLLYVGNHGLERWEAGRQKGRAAFRPWRAALSSAMSALRRDLAQLPGLRIEDKGVSFSVHYRLAPNHGAARSTVLAATQRAVEPYRLTIREAKKVVEVGPPEWPGKAEAVAALIDQYGLKSVVYLGDDQPDVEVFDWLAGRDPARLRTLSVAVDGVEADPRLLELAGRILEGPAHVAAFLGDLAGALTVAEDGRVAGRP